MKKTALLSVLFALIIALISSTAAYAASLSISPPSPLASQDVTCTYNGAVNVVNGWYAYLFTFRWFEFNADGTTSKIYGPDVDATDVTQDPSVVLPSSKLTAGKTYKCVVYDTMDNAMSSILFSTQGTNPAGGQVNIIPANPDGTTTQLECAMNSDGKYAYLYTFRWFNNGVKVKETYGTANAANKPSSTLTSSETPFTRFVEFRCEAWAGNTKIAEDAVIINNRAPVFNDPIQNVTFPEDGNFTINLIGNFTELDNDPLIYSYITTNPNIILSFSGNNATISYSVPNGIGSGFVIINATDGYSNSYAESNQF